MFASGPHRQRGGGVSVIIQQDIKFYEWKELQDDNLETLWLTLFPSRMPRPFLTVTIGATYHPHPTGYKYDKPITYHICQSVDYIKQRHPQTGLFIAGDFYQYKDTFIKKSLSLKQIITKPTRNNAILDKVFTNMHAFYGRF